MVASWSPTERVVSKGRRKAEVKERAGKYTVKFYLIDDDGHEEEMGGHLASNMTSAMARCSSWLEYGNLP